MARYLCCSSKWLKNSRSTSMYMRLIQQRSSRATKIEPTYTFTLKRAQKRCHLLTSTLITRSARFEYTDVDTSLISTHRVLNPGATLTLVSHHRSSWLSRESFDILRQLIGIEESGLINTLSDLLRRLDILQSRSLDPSKDQEAEKLREALHSTAKELQDKTSKTAFDPTFTLQVISAALRVFKEEHREKSHVNLLQDAPPTPHGCRRTKMLPCPMKSGPYSRIRLIELSLGRILWSPRSSSSSIAR